MTNFFGNVADAWSAVNNVLQGKFAERRCGHRCAFSFNTVFGFFGVLDIASEMGLEHQYEDFGQTLGRWGVGAGAYIVLPLLGPSTVREPLALPLDRRGDAGAATSTTAAPAGRHLTLQHRQHARQPAATRAACSTSIALDKYSFMRDAYLQRRRSLVFDGDPPEPPRRTMRRPALRRARRRHDPRPRPGPALPTAASPGGLRAGEMSRPPFAARCEPTAARRVTVRPELATGPERGASRGSKRGHEPERLKRC